MIYDEPLWVLSCPFCELFKNNKTITRIYWPEDINLISKSEFIIIDSPVDKNPIVIFRDHTDSVLDETWGNILYRCRKLFGDSVRLKINTKISKDHFYCDIKI